MQSAEDLPICETCKARHEPGNAAVCALFQHGYVFMESVRPHAGPYDTAAFCIRMASVCLQSCSPGLTPEEGAVFMMRACRDFADAIKKARKVEN